eukprot:COSAG06_NODE_7768_length_2381_cov_58.729623_3_plen_113_part_01
MMMRQKVGSIEHYLPNPRAASDGSTLNDYRSYNRYCFPDGIRFRPRAGSFEVRRLRRKTKTTGGGGGGGGVFFFFFFFLFFFFFCFFFFFFFFFFGGGGGGGPCLGGCVLGML